MLSGVLQILTTVAAQNPDPTAVTLPSWFALVNMGPYGVIIVLCIVVRHLYTQREADNKAHAQEIRTLNDRILDVSTKTTAAVTQNTEVQRQLLDVIESK